ncbi:MAG TPA: polysaccharide deacetylase family protein [Micromonosporaceae bacterium]|nr:polysaccharide deacetylase family protein [Micromonosporaceae bacterium]
MVTNRIVLVFLALPAVLMAGCSDAPAKPSSTRAAAVTSVRPTGVGPSAVTTSPPATAPGAGGPATAPSAGRHLAGSSPIGSPPPLIAHGPRNRKQVALTFDADMTDAMAANLRSGRVRSYANLAVIDLLEHRKVPATFFVTGQWAEQYPTVMRRLASNPQFEFANHSYEHAAFTGDCYGLPRVPPHAMTDDVAKTFTVLTPFGGRQTRYFRFPGLCHDGAAMAALAPLGVTVVDGDVVSGDPFATAAAPIVRAVLSQVQAGSIVIMHVTEANARFTDEALPPILDGLRERGLRPVTLSTLMGGT